MGDWYRTPKHSSAMDQLAGDEHFHQQSIMNYRIRREYGHNKNRVQLIQAIRERPDTGALQVLQDRVIGGTSCFILVSKILYPKRGERMSPSPSRFFY